MAAPSKIESLPDGTPSSIESTPEPDGDAEPSQEPVQPQKRKGGRKPIYATSEERKQRNRQAQAAFRERRTEYIKQLEATIKQNEDSLASLQQSHRTAADECLMLRYKNSLLERILLEKGIDVQAELQMKTSSPVLGPGFMTHTGLAPVQQPPLQRTALQRQQARRSAGQPHLPKLAPGQSNTDMNLSKTSPHAHPTPSSHASSPSQMSTRSPMVMQQGGTASPTSGQSQAQQFHNFARSSQQQHPNHSLYQAPQHALNGQRQVQRPAPSPVFTNSSSGTNPHSMGQPMHVGNNGGNVSQSASAFYPSPFQKHFEQLDQDYDAQQSQPMLEDLEPEEVNGTVRSPVLHGAYPPQFDHAHYQQAQGMQAPPASIPIATGGNFVADSGNSVMDADPFGLSASMHYPTGYAFDQHVRH
ncbi:unnamed protein product [Zymoseptoria tritici ST99CH_3D1]|uniref:BZIP domain-containing protein n=2 Tax=Zymoseptoria tritici TaxID=1047171 RepID=A0A1X7REE1_ZYMT9|nr:unnamed protein product [Zymoseptoria tritici ST99CH_3D7]SMR42134.1 unnamed protein product [Zymoseptoria tritici ST99CH_1E4]SMR44315.1 unnamed protein product [Zymoseptoria tritici ST99CH_3D1]